MSLYYRDDNVTLYHGDCLAITEWLGADVLVTDPPYGMAFVSSWTTQKRPVANDESTEVRDTALSQWGNKPAAVFGTWRVAKPHGVRQVLIWDKRGAGPGMGDLTTAFGTSHEEVYLLGKWEKKTTRRGSVITTDSSPSELTTRIGHPTPKPVGLMETLVSTAPDGVIADPFAGGGVYVSGRPKPWPTRGRRRNRRTLLRIDRQSARPDVPRLRRSRMKRAIAITVTALLTAPAANAVPEFGMSGLCPNAVALAQYVVANYPVHSIGGVRPDRLPDHPSGHALDLMVDGDMALGDRIYADLSSHMAEHGIKYLLWKVPHHFDHVHVTVL